MVKFVGNLHALFKSWLPLTSVFSILVSSVTGTFKSYTTKAILYGKAFRIIWWPCLIGETSCAGLTIPTERVIPLKNQSARKLPMTHPKLLHSCAACQKCGTHGGCIPSHFLIYESNRQVVFHPIF